MTATSRYLQIDSYPVLDPGEFRHPRCNSIYIPRGIYPGDAWVIVSRQISDNYLSPNTVHSLTWRDGQTSVTFQGYYIADAKNLDMDGDSQSAVVVHLQDKRAPLWRSPACNKRFNALKPYATYKADGTYAASKKYSLDSLNISSLWTWEEIWGELWDMLPVLAGSVPSLPYTPTGTPKQLTKWLHRGISAWQACGEFLHLIGCDLVYDPASGGFSVVRLGTTQSSGMPSTSLRPLVNWRDRDTLYSNDPQYIEVAFPVMTPAHHGGLQAPYLVTPSGFITGPQNQTKMTVWDSTVAHGIDGSFGELLDAADLDNASEINARAAEIVDNVRNRITVSERPAHVVYSGIVSGLQCGSQVSELLYRDLGDNDEPDSGTVTEIFRRRMQYPEYGPSAITPSNLVYARTKTAVDRNEAVTCETDSSGYEFLAANMEQPLGELNDVLLAWSPSSVPNGGSAAQFGDPVIIPLVRPAFWAAITGSGITAQSGAVELGTSTQIGGEIATVSGNSFEFTAEGVFRADFAVKFLISGTAISGPFSGRVTLSCSGAYAASFPFRLFLVESGMAVSDFTFSGSAIFTLAAGNTVGLTYAFDQAIPGGNTLNTTGYLSVGHV